MRLFLQIHIVSSGLFGCMLLRGASSGVMQTRQGRTRVGRVGAKYLVLTGACRSDIIKSVKPLAPVGWA